MNSSRSALISSKPRRLWMSNWSCGLADKQRVDKAPLIKQPPPRMMAIVFARIPLAQTLSGSANALCVSNTEIERSSSSSSSSILLVDFDSDSDSTSAALRDFSFSYSSASAVLRGASLRLPSYYEYDYRTASVWCSRASIAAR